MLRRVVIALLLTVSTTARAELPCVMKLGAPDLAPAPALAAPVPPVANRAGEGGVIGAAAGVVAGGVLAAGSMYALDALQPPCAECEGYLGPEINTVLAAMFTVPIGAVAGLVVGMLIGSSLAVESEADVADMPGRVPQQ